MRRVLIIVQAGIISLLAVVGAHSETDASQACPLPSVQTDTQCQN